MQHDVLKWLLDYAASAHDTELKATDIIRDRGSLLLSLMITPSFGVLVYLAINMRGEKPLAYWNLIFFWIPWVLSAVLLSVASYFCIRYALNTSTGYLKVPSPLLIHNFVTQNDRFGKRNLLEQVSLGLLTEYEKCVDHNAAFNEHRKSKLVKVQKLGSIALLFVFLCIPKWAHNFYNNDQEHLPIKILALPLTQPIQEDYMSQTAPVNVPQQQTAPVSQSKAPSTFPSSRMAFSSADTPRVTFPQSRMVFESRDPFADKSKR